VKASHVEAVKMLKEKGWRIIVDDKVGCIVVVESGCLYERIRSYVLASYD
jgi:DNA polymerase elongation subunit (family B)